MSKEEEAQEIAAALYEHDNPGGYGWKELDDIDLDTSIRTPYLQRADVVLNVLDTPRRVNAYQAQAAALRGAARAFIQPDIVAFLGDENAYKVSKSLFDSAAMVEGLINEL